MSEVLSDLDTIVESPTIDAPIAESAAPEAKAEPVKEAVKEPERSVPLAAHLEERRQYKAEIEAERASRAALEARLAKLESPPAAPVPQPEFIEDPKGYVDHRVQAALDQLNSVKQEVDKTGKSAEQIATETRYNRFMSDLQTTEMQFKAATPDYLDALNHLRTVRATEIQLTYPNATQEQIIEGLRREELGLAHQLMQAGRNPHEVAYQLAKARGYTPKGAAPAVPNVAGKTQLPPDQTLGSGAGSPNAGDNAIPEGEEFDLAMKQMFGRKRA